MKRLVKTLGLLTAALISQASHAKDDGVTKIKLDPTKTFQEISGFGASDAWRCQFVGENWPIRKREKIADLLFSTKNDRKGNPIGIGLSNWRFYLGAGSYEQGDQSDIQNVWRRSECFVDAEGNYDWDKYKGQQWFLKEAKKRGLPSFTAFTISPPVFYTKNGLAHAKKGDLSFNLKPNHGQDYAKYLVDVIEHFEKTEGIHFEYLSPFNEPQWAWDKSNQEGTPATNKELFQFVKTVSSELHSRKLTTKLLVGEAGRIEYLHKKLGDNDNGDQIDAFFLPGSRLYMGNLPNVENAITSHSYFTTWPIKKLVESRQELAKHIKKRRLNLDYHQTEFCILEPNPEITGGKGRDLGMGTALYVARVIHSDLTITNAKSWEWWTALSQFDYKDGLIHLDDGVGNGISNGTSKLSEQLMSNGEITETKLLWAFGNYSRFVRPGAIRIEASLENELSLVEQATDLQLSAYKDLDRKELILVFINHTKEDKDLNLDLVKSFKSTLYVTDKSRNLERSNISSPDFSVPPRSVSTLVLKKR